MKKAFADCANAFYHNCPFFDKKTNAFCNL